MLVSWWMGGCRSCGSARGCRGFFSRSSIRRRSAGTAPDRGRRLHVETRERVLEGRHFHGLLEGIVQARLRTSRACLRRDQAPWREVWTMSMPSSFSVGTWGKRGMRLSLYHGAARAACRRRTAPRPRSRRPTARAGQQRLQRFRRALVRHVVELHPGSARELLHRQVVGGPDAGAAVGEQRPGCALA